MTKAKDSRPILLTVSAKVSGILSCETSSISRRGNLNFHWKFMMAPATVLNYISVHEIVHLLHRNHTEAFWNEVDKVMPNYRERKQWLRVNEAGMNV